MDSAIPLPPELVDFFGALTPAQQVAAQLVVILNAAADPAYKSRYRRRWWGIVEERVRLGAMTSESLTRWSSTVSSRLGGTVGRNESHRSAWASLMATDVPGGEVLDALENDAAVAVAFARALGDLKRAEWEADQDDAP